MSIRSHEVLERVDTIVGYTTYIDLIRPLIQGKNVLTTPMKKEVDRVNAALDIALKGRSCAIISSGDPGIYAMAGLVFEVCKQKKVPIVSPSSNAGPTEDTSKLRVEVVPGIPALCAGSALLGAPLTHDFAAISLSDLLTPWERIEQRIALAAQADFVIVLYNPKSKKRDWQLASAQKIILKHRSGSTPVGIVTRAMREGQDVRIVTLKNLHTAPVDMQTAVFIGSSASIEYLDFMITPRGYASKYSIDEQNR
jgi:precorrin-3B C17-methyltransferase